MNLRQHSKFMRRIREGLPKVTTEEAHAQARRVLADAETVKPKAIETWFRTA